MSTTGDVRGTQRSPGRAVAALAGPAIAQQLLHTLVFLVDRGMRGHHGADALASMQINGPVVWSTFAILAAYTVGAIALVGRRFGAHDLVGANAAVRATLGFGLAIGLLAWVLGLLLLPLLLGLFPAAGAAVRDAARGYLLVAFGAMPLLLLSYASATVLQAAGNTRVPFAVAASGNVLNVGVNYILIFGRFGAPALGAQGAAIGSAVALGWQTLALLWILGRPWSPVSWRGRGHELEALRRMLRVAGAAVAERIVQQTGFMIFVGMIGMLGSLAMASNQALISIESVAFLSADGFGMAAAAVVAQRLGANEPGQSAAGMRAGVWMAVATLSLYGVGFLVVGDRLLAAFTDDPEIVVMGLPCLYVAAVAQPFMAAAVVFSQALRGAGDTRTALAVTFVGGLVVRLTATWTFAFVFELGLVGVWLGSTSDWIVRAALFTAAYRRGAWQRVAV